MDISGWLSGYLYLELSGRFPERFVNLCAIRGIYIKDATKVNDKIYFKVRVKAFRKMTVPSARSSCRVKIIKKAGLPFLLQKLKKRKVFMFGALGFMAIILFLNSFIWSVKIDGNEKLTEDEIKFIASYCGLRQGVVKYKVDEKSFSEKALSAEPRLSWIWPEIKGTVCYIHVREKETGITPVDTKKPADVIAMRDGVITGITVKRGWAMVKEGDSVVKGQLLISSFCEGQAPVHAMGEVYASFWEKESLTASSEKEVITYTGNEKNIYSIVIGSFGMRFCFSGKIPYEDFEEEKEEKDLRLFGEINLPVKLIKTEYKEIRKDKITVDEEKAVRDAEREIINAFKEKLLPEVSISKTTTITEKVSKTDTLVTVIFECSRNIAIEKMKD